MKWLRHKGLRLKGILIICLTLLEAFRRLHKKGKVACSYLPFLRFLGDSLQFWIGGSNRSPRITDSLNLELTGGNHFTKKKNQKRRTKKKNQKETKKKRACLSQTLLDFLVETEFELCWNVEAAFADRRIDIFFLFFLFVRHCVPLEAGSCRNQTSDDDVFLQAA
jgi:hypothetical protein